MANGLVGHGELSQVMANHVGLNFNWIPVFSTVHINDGSAHFWDNNGVSEMSFDTLWLFTDNAFLLGSSEFLDKSIIL